MKPAALTEQLDEGGFEDTRRHNLPGPYPFTLITGRR